MKNIRHGDLVLIGVEKLPEELKESQSKVLMTGSNNNDHSFDNGQLFVKENDQFIIGYLVAKNTTLYHPDHGADVGKALREVKLMDGVYELRRQFEYTNAGMKQVVD